MHYSSRPLILTYKQELRAKLRTLNCSILDEQVVKLASAFPTWPSTHIVQDNEWGSFPGAHVKRSISYLMAYLTEQTEPFCTVCHEIAHSCDICDPPSQASSAGSPPRSPGKPERKNAYRSRERKINCELLVLADESAVELWFGDCGIMGEEEGRSIWKISSQNWPQVIDRLNRCINSAHKTCGQRVTPAENLTQCMRDCGVVPRRQPGQSIRSWMAPQDGVWEWSFDAAQGRRERLERQYASGGSKRPRSHQSPTFNSLPSVAPDQGHPPATPDHGQSASEAIIAGPDCPKGTCDVEASAEESVSKRRRLAHEEQELRQRPETWSPNASSAPSHPRSHSSPTLQRHRTDASNQREGHPLAMPDHFHSVSEAQMDSSAAPKYGCNLEKSPEAGITEGRSLAQEEQGLRQLGVIASEIWAANQSVPAAHVTYAAKLAALPGSGR